MELNDMEKIKIQIGLEDHVRRLEKHIETCEEMEIKSRELKQIVNTSREEIADYKSLINKIWTEDEPKSPFDALLSCAEAAELWKIDSSAIRKAIADGRLKDEIDCRKFGKQWIVTRNGMDRVFSKEKLPF